MSYGTVSNDNGRFFSLRSSSIYPLLMLSKGKIILNNNGKGNAPFDCNNRFHRSRNGEDKVTTILASSIKPVDGKTAVSPFAVSSAVSTPWNEFQLPTTTRSHLICKIGSNRKSDANKSAPLSRYVRKFKRLRI